MIYIILVGALAGWFSGKIMKGRSFGLLGNIVIGILGSFMGSWLLPILGVSVGEGILSTVFEATLGAVAIIFLAGLIRR